jgi:hypothetical protein
MPAMRLPSTHPVPSTRRASFNSPSTSIRAQGPTTFFLIKPVNLASLDNPSVVIDKSPGAQSVPIGGAATFTIAVTNTGDVELRQTAIADPATLARARTAAQVRQPTNTKGTSVGFRLTPGESFSYTCTKTNVTSGFTNTATVTVTEQGNPVAHADNADVQMQ